VELGEMEVILDREVLPPKPEELPPPPKSPFNIEPLQKQMLSIMFQDHLHSSTKIID